MRYLLDFIIYLSLAPNVPCTPVFGRYPKINPQLVDFTSTVVVMLLS